MSKLIEALEAKGCDMETTLERFLNDEDFYENCLFEMLDDKNFELLGECLEKNDIDAAFNCAHTLKGLVANMGLESLLNIIVKIVEPLRNGINDGVMDIYRQFMDEKEEYRKIVESVSRI